MIHYRRIDVKGGRYCVRERTSGLPVPQEDQPMGCLAMGNQSISSARNYLDNGGMWSARGMDDRGASKYSVSITIYRSGAKGYGRPRPAPPDLPSLIFDTRNVYLVMPVVL
ncbi:hypothetical protein SOVF_196490 [Spinacia oleracea]|nr:hypothetical protein SOVF_196490 [Spinacia oleracea]